ncbi:MAG: hypothetical protein FWD36_04950 [Treponema sp.]|nr:hypothetical protein [Treponema sp.]
MAIQPIDLQTLFSQMDKVAKTQVAQREGVALQQAIQGAEIERKTEEHIKSVNEAQNTGDGTEKVNDRGARHGKEKHKGNAQEHDNPESEETQTPVIHDPSLGRNIDISL